MNDIREDRLYELLPVVYRMRDAEQGKPLRAMLRVIAEQVNLVEDDIHQLYENWFIETCEDWVVPYLGDLVGYEPVHEAGEPSGVDTLQGRQRNKILIPRREVANTIRYRRRKGTLALLELLANDVAGWPARAVEFRNLLSRTQAINHQQPDQGQTVDLRKGAALDLLDSSFDTIAHSVDVRRINSICRFLFEEGCLKRRKPGSTVKERACTFGWENSTGRERKKRLFLNPCCRKILFRLTSAVGSIYRLLARLLWIRCWAGLFFQTGIIRSTEYPSAIIMASV